MLTRITAPKQVIQIADIKDDLHIRHTDDDRLLERLIERATQYLDGYSGILGRAIVSQQWKKTFPMFSSKMRLEIGKLISIDSIVYQDDDDAQQTLGSAIYDSYEDTRSPYIVLAFNQSWPNTFVREDAVTVTFTVGYGDRTAVPEPVKAAISLLVGHYYENTEAVDVTKTHPVAMGVEDIIAPFRAFF